MTSKWENRLLLVLRFLGKCFIATQVVLYLPAIIIKKDNRWLVGCAFTAWGAMLYIGGAWLFTWAFSSVAMSAREWLFVLGVWPFALGFMWLTCGIQVLAREITVKNRLNLPHIAS